MDIARLRLNNQHISGRPCTSAEEVVRSLGAIQAQDYNHALWATGLRMRPNAVVADVEQALRDGRILRTWIMRGTLHFILPEDARWMIKLLAERVMARLTPKIWAYHGTTEKMMDLARDTFVESLRGGKALTRRAMIELLADVGIPNDKQQGYFMFGYLCQTGVLCPGPPQGKDQTFTLLDEWAPDQRALSYEESLAELARRFFTSHGPATIADFANWAGIRVSEANAGLESVRDDLVHEKFAGTGYWLPPHSRPGSGAYLLPAYDELLIGYKDRDPSFTTYGTIPISTYNGMFHSTIIDDGQVAGLWKRVVRKDLIDVELRPVTAIDTGGYSIPAQRLGSFWGKEIRLVVKEYVAPPAKSWQTR